jgi:hypothetical protein
MCRPGARRLVAELPRGRGRRGGCGRIARRMVAGAQVGAAPARGVAGRGPDPAAADQPAAGDQHLNPQLREIGKVLTMTRADALGLASRRARRCASWPTRYGSDKGDRDQLRARLSSGSIERILAHLPARRRSRMAEIGLIHVFTQAEFAGRLEQSGCPSLRMWADYLPQAAEVCGLDIADLVGLGGGADPHRARRPGEPRRPRRPLPAAHGPFDLIIDDGSHASHHQQVSLAALFPHLAPGGLYIIEDLHFQPAELEVSGITRTREFLRHMLRPGEMLKLPLSQAEYGYLLANVAAVNFFDSLSPKWAAQQAEDAMAVIRKAGEHAWLPPLW